MKTDKNLKRNLLICLLAGSAVAYTLPLHAATSVIANSTLPTGGNFVVGGGSIKNSGLQMDITQSLQNAVIKWTDFSIGGSATVNFAAEGDYANNFNTLNYVNGNNLSQIYGTINAEGGNIYLVNPAGVQIGNSAQINVGSFHASTQTLNEDALSGFAGTITGEMIANPGSADAVLMSLGNINASKVTFEGNGRIVIDTERLLDASGDNKLDAANIIVNTAADNTGNIVLGYDAYNDEVDGETGKVIGYTNAAVKNNLATVTTENSTTTVAGYMWVEDVEQLQAINTNLSGSYALRNSIDGTEASAFKAIAGGTNDEYFTGKFDGLDYSIFNLNIKGDNNVGLFGKASGAAISNLSLVGGSISGGNYVGAVVGYANEGTTITNAINSASVKGSQNVGGIVGYGNDTTVNNAVNTGAVSATTTTEGTSSNVGGLIGNMSNDSKLTGNSYNLGDVSGTSNNVGGLVGSATGSTIGDGTNLVYNRLDVTGAYNVGGIVGSMQGSTVQYAENSGTVLATGNTTVNYDYHAGQQVDDNKNQHQTVSKTANNVQVANAGGIAGNSSSIETNEGLIASTIKNVTNTADISTATETSGQLTYYKAGNVGGVVGKAVNTNITNATNKENAIRGAHNVGGVAGYFGGTGTVTGGINDGGDIMATGARDETGFVREQVNGRNTSEAFIVGNIGGIVGYMEGDGVYITASANRGTVHSQDIADQNNVLDTSKAANVGGIVGKIDRNTTKEKTEFSNVDSYTSAAVSNSYNTGDVMGYTGVGGIAGMMYNGEVVGSYNLGYMQSTRQASTNSGSIDSLNMGGIVGDSTANTGGKITLYDVYNKGQIGDEEFAYFGRHIGGIVGRLSGDVEKAYNTGDIYNGYNVVGGIAGWLYKGSIDNAFNTGNITVNNKNSATSQVGGLVGAAANYASISITNAYNLGTIRSFKANDGANSLGGIIGQIFSGYGSGNVNISNVYTTGNLYVDNGTIGSVYGTNEIGNALTVNNAYYITPEDGNGFTNLSNNANSQGATAVSYSEKSTYGYTFTGGITTPATNQGNVDENSAWRIYPGTTPILNAFLPNAESYFSNNGSMSGISSIQYGTAYDPLLTIIKAANGTNDFTYSWSDLGISNAAGIAVYGAGLTLNGVDTSSGSGYFGGTIYTDGALNLNSNSSIGLGSGADIYGSAVNIEADGNITIYGDLTATGNTANGAAEAVDDTITVTNVGDITIKGSNVDVYGTLTSAKEDASVTVPGINDSVSAGTQGSDAIGNPNTTMTSVADRYAYTTGASAVNGDITVEATNGNVGLYYGNKGEGITTTGGNLTVTGTGDVYVDSDLNIGGNLTLNSTGANSEVVLDITNIGQVQADNGTVADALTGLHNFMHHFEKSEEATANLITLNSASGDAKLAVDMWDDERNAFNLDKYDGNEHTLLQELNSLNISASTLNSAGEAATSNSAEDVTHIWVSTAEQLQGIQDYYNAQNKNTGALTYNYALKNDINAADLQDYEAIGTGSDSGFTGTFDGRGNRIIGLDATKATDANGNATTQTLTNAGIFSTVGEGGTVKNVNIYSSTFTGTATAGAVAGINNGTIDNITTFGNTVTVTGDGGNAGGIAGTNNSTGTINDVESTGTVIAGGVNAIAGGLVGSNSGTVNESYSNSAVTATTGTNAGLGGVVGVNTGTVELVDSLGVTNGGAHLSNNVGGVIGINNGTLNSAYNESIVSGKDNVGGIIGTNSSTVTNIVNATSVTGLDFQDGTGTMVQSTYVGGLVGTNSGSVSNGRNSGTITGTNYVGGMVGSNAAGAELTNLVNGESATITGVTYVGGIAGTNAGTISSNEQGLSNLGKIYGFTYAGGIAGSNSGTIQNVNNDVELYVNSNVAQTNDNKPSYFGGVAGLNTGTIADATNEADVNAYEATYVGGVVGQNLGTLQNMAGNTGNVTGYGNVGGVVGLNGAANANTVNITNVEASNTGMVIATNGGAGGIFAVNHGDVTGSTLSNSGVVAGTNGVGGIFGTNTGSVSTSSLKNEVNGQVYGTSDVGGLIGVNSGEITGGRNDEDTMYVHKIYNNGVINVGTYTENANGEYEFNAGTGSNIGGLIGSNAAGGSLTAAYNTGAINAEGSSSVGGVVGSNAGTVDQVFNTVMTADGEGAITGGSNTGGVIGTNSGTLQNAYNTTAVTGAEDYTGNVVGSNIGTISMVYATNTSGKLIGSNENTAEDAVTSAYSFSSNETTDGVTVIADADRQNASSYAGFDFDSTDDTAAIWKNYDGSGNPLLKVFLTKAQVAEGTNTELVYNAQNQGLAVSSVTAADELAAYNNANSLLSATQNKNAGQDYLAFYSQQIAASGTEESFNPNNLGYDIDTTYDIGKAQIKVSLDEISREYGNATLTNKVTGGNDYGYTYDFANVDNNEALRKELGSNIVFTQKTDGAVDGLQEGQSTNNVGDYTWSADFSLNDSVKNNYEFVTQSNGDVIAAGSTLNVDNGVSKVTQTTLTVSLNDVERVYGSADFTNNKGYGISYVGGNLNGATAESITGNLNFMLADKGDGALDYNDNSRVTKDVGSYYYKGSVTAANETFNKNYKIVVQNADSTTNDSNIGNGNSKVTKATIKVNLGNVQHTYGKPSDNYTIASVKDWVNGDNYTLQDVVINKGTISDKAIDANGHTNNAGGNYTWNAEVNADGTNAEAIKKNYKIEVVEGNSEVAKAELTINLGEVTHTYGEPNSNGYNIKDVTGWAYGEDYTEAVSIGSLGSGITDAALKDNNTHTNNANTAENPYSWTTDNYSISGDGATNYIIKVVKAGKSYVAKKDIAISADDVTATVGSVPNTFTGTDINKVLVNGDVIGEGIYSYGVSAGTDTNAAGEYKVGIYVNGTYYELSNPDWSKEITFMGNYNVTFTPGTLTVSGTTVVPEPEVPTFELPENWPSNRWDYLFSDYPFDRNRNFRERKAEVNYVDGGMEI